MDESVFLGRIIVAFEDHKIVSVDKFDRRVDGPVDLLDEAVVLATLEGVGPAIDHMISAGIELRTALRVLSGPEYHRPVKNETIAKTLNSMLKNHF